ncbi:hypothetical protein JZ751_009215 [Albula glossodonta]|uniref:Caspase-8 n=1 Tax=Albula glossodonta TaxID=121402 RepID=A0A8T2N8P6_9TELE|nr:hypothetical protein JZ751_009215 [Albula glossodonta]
MCVAETPDAGTEAASLSLSQTCSVGVTDQFSSACEEKNQNQTEPFPERQSKIDAYQMKDDRRRGYCLIINNHDFTKSTKCLKNRDGTEVDEKSLKLVFDWLGFKTQIEPDCSVQRMLSLMEELSRRDHSRMDCLVVCVLSHGDRDLVYGVDGRKVNLGELKKPFSGARCRSLVGKPKLFFIQACQGQAEQLPVHIEADSPDLSTDAIVPQGSIPDDADFLLGMATVPNFASFRDRKQGTWFIQSLCQNLLEMVPSGHDLVTILTKVNNHVSRMTDRAGTRKQMPQPSFTLRKIIVFPVPKTPPPMLKVLTAVISQADNPNSHYEASSLGRDTPL